MASILNIIVKNYLSEFLEINPDKTVANLFSGTVELENIKFKKTLFNALNVSFLELEDGYIGKIKVKLSLPRFYLYPIIVNVDKIYVRIKPKDVNKITKEEILKIYDDFKNKQLLAFEEKIKNKIKEIENKNDETKEGSEEKKDSNDESYF